MVVWHGHCEDTVVHSVLSSSGLFRAETRETNCRSKQKTATQIFLQRKDGDQWTDETSVVLYQGYAAAAPKWESESQVLLTIPGDAPVIRHTPEYHGITVKQEVLPKSTAKTSEDSRM
jgi:hypothetical protein